MNRMGLNLAYFLHFPYFLREIKEVQEIPIDPR
jgi:hypothetical protein